MYKVICSFADSCDDGNVYLTGDTYPREGLEPSEERIIELASTANGRGFPVIEKVDDPVEETHAEEIPVEETPAQEEPEPEEKPSAKRGGRRSKKQ